MLYSRRDPPPPPAPSCPSPSPSSSTSKEGRACVGNAGDIGTPAEVTTADSGADEATDGSSDSAEATTASVSDLESSVGIGFSPGNGDGGDGRGDSESEEGEEKEDAKSNTQMKTKRGVKGKRTVDDGFGWGRNAPSAVTPTRRPLAQPGACLRPEVSDGLLSYFVCLLICSFVGL